MNNKFFRIKIQRLLDKLPTPVQFNESQWAMVENLDQSRFCVHIAARRTGKSYAAAILAFAKLLEPGQQVMVVAPNFSLSSIIWDYVTDLIRQLDIEVERFNQKDKVVKLINGSVFRLLSANNRDSLVGRAANLLIVDEAAIIPNDEYYTRDLRPALSTFTDSRCLWISTPRGKGNYLYDYYLRGEDPEYPDWSSSIHTWRSNPLLSETDVEEARRTITKALYLQEYECEWTTTESQIYLDLDEEKHIGDYVGERFSEVIGGLDVGYRDENVFVVIGTDGNNYFLVDEFISKESTTSELAAEIQEKINEWGIDTIYIDSAAQQVKADFAYDYDIYCENAIKSVNDGINSLQVLIEQDRLYFDTEGARHTFSAMSAYKWNPNTENPKPVHDWASHPCDAVRYAIYTHQKMSNITIYA
ncbi:MAG: terminase [Puniceicoccaceae bacterium]|jgi:PBSX family phage terminase large subunit|nr:terminase [Puniceicoccaceae bacterium]|tara:strand:- start:1391 stop:2638 length:1248 start_codon:yes stop_codon:yes gene_type:complete